MAADDYAMVVGISKYKELESLDGPENDAQAFYEWLRSEAGGNVPDANVSLILSSDFAAADKPSRPQTGEIDTAFEQLHTGFESDTGRTGRRLYVFLAGHGFAPGFSDAALLMANASRLRLGHHISVRLYAEWFLKAALFKEVVVFMDCCRDDYMSTPFRGPPWGEQHRPDDDIKYFYGFATKWSRKSRERADESGIVRGLFTTALLSGLKSVPTTSGDLRGLVFNYLNAIVKRNEYQEPVFQGDEDISFSEAAKKTSNVIITFSRPHEGGPVELFDGEMRPVDSHSPGEDVWRKDLEVGAYLLRVPDSGLSRRFDVYGGETRVQF